MKLSEERKLARSKQFKLLCLVLASCLGSEGSALNKKASKALLIFRARAEDNSPTHKKLVKSGLRFRRLKKSRLVLIEDNDQLAATQFKSDAEFSFLEEDRRWHSADYVSLQSPENDTWVPDFFENSRLPTQSADSNDQSVVLGIVDSGLKTSHPFFKGLLAINQKEASGLSGHDDDGNGFVDDVYGANTYNTSAGVDTPGSDHGTHVASLAALSIRESNMAVADQIRILPVNFMANGEYGSTSSALIAIDYAIERGAKVVNLSWGGAGIESFSHALYGALSDLYEKDVLVIAAAGNEGNNNDTRPFFPASYNLPNVISVASVSPSYGYGSFLLDMGLSFFSNFGVDSVDVAAPGSLEVGGSSIGLLGANGGRDSNSIPYVRMMGTSMAAPVVAGVAAVVRALNSKITAHQAKEIILESSRYSSFGTSLSINGGVVSPASAYQQAIATRSSAEDPPIPADPVRGNAQKLEDSGHSFGGCAQVETISRGPPEGPLGGNSLILMAMLYFLSVALKRRNSLLRKV